ncbi:MAG: hypothetical protein ACI814_001341 [Mariniblastus sp.]|jgi:hypothetical protein
MVDLTETRMPNRLDTFGHSSAKKQNKCSVVHERTFGQIGHGVQVNIAKPGITGGNAAETVENV